LTGNIRIISEIKSETVRRSIPRGGKSGFFLVIGLTVLFELPVFTPHFLPRYDSLHKLTGFYNFYSAVKCEGVIPQWVPNGSYGIQNIYNQLNFISPALYTAGVLGILYDTDNVMFLFTLAQTFEVILLALGMYMLSLMVYKRVSAALITAAAAAGTTVWWYQTNFNLSVLYLLPIGLYFLICFFNERRSVYFWLFAVCAVYHTIGSAPYFIAVHMYVYCIAGVYLLVRRKQLFDSAFYRALIPDSRVSWILCIWFMISAVSVLLLGSHMYEGSTGLHPMRNPETGKVLMESFLSSARGISYRKAFTEFFTGITVHGDIFFYAGIFSLIFPLYALKFCTGAQRELFLLWMCIVLLLTGLAGGGIIARMLFNFPFMAYYCHLSYLYPLIKIFLILAAGLGIDNFLSGGYRFRKPGNAVITLLVLPGAGVLIGLALGIDLQNVKPNFFIPGAVFTSADVLALFNKNVIIIRLLLYGFCAVFFMLFYRRHYSPYNRFFRYIFIFVCLADILFFRWTLYLGIPEPPSDYVRAKKWFKPEAQPYHPRRLVPAEFDDNRYASAYAFLDGNVQYIHADYFLRRDPLFPSRYPRIDIFNSGIIDFVSTRKGRVHCMGIDVPMNDEFLVSRLGNTLPKLRMSRSVTFAHTYAAALSLLSVPHPVGDVIISEYKTGMKPFSGESDTYYDSLQIADHRSGALTVITDCISDAWLIWADGYHRGWRCTVNGAGQKVYRANLGFKAVPVPAGRSTVDFSFFEPVTFFASYTVAVTAILFVCMLSLVIAGMYFTVGGDCANGTK